MRLKRKGWEFLFSLIGLLLLWQLLAWGLNRPIVPYPLTVFGNLLDIFTARIDVHLYYSLGRVVAGILLSLIIGVPVGVLMGYFPGVDKIFAPLVYFTYPIPKIALLPVIMLLFGLGETSKLIMIVLIVIFQVIITTRDAVKNIPPEMFRSLQSLGAHRRQVYTEIILPASLPDILTASRLSLGTAISILFFTETFGTEYGMGYFIMDAWMRMNYLDMYAGIVVLSLLGCGIFVALDFIEEKLCSWQN